MPSLSYATAQGDAHHALESTADVQRLRLALRPRDALLDRFVDECDCMRVVLRVERLEAENQGIVPGGGGFGGLQNVTCSEARVRHEREDASL